MLKALAACGLLIGASQVQRLAADVSSIDDDKPIDLCRAHQGLAPRRRR